MVSQTSAAHSNIPPSESQVNLPTSTSFTSAHDVETNSNNSSPYVRRHSNRVLQFFDYLWMDIVQAYRGARRNIAQYLLGCGSIFLVVVLVSILLTAISYSPAIFLSMSEMVSGELDLKLFPSGYAPYAKINYTAFQQKHVSLAAVSAARISDIGVSIFDIARCQGFDTENPTSSLFSYEGPAIQNSLTDEIYIKMLMNLRDYCSTVNGRVCASKLCSNQRSAEGSLVGIDTEKEKELQIGRAWPFPSLAPGTCIVHSLLAQTLGIRKGNSILMSFNFTSFFLPTYNFALSKAKLNSTYTHNIVNFICKVYDVIPDFYGKLPKSMENAVLMEKKHFGKLIYDNIPPYFNSQFKEAFIEQVSANNLADQYINEVILPCDKNRITCYINSNYEEIAKKIVDWSSNIIEKLDYRSFSSSLPVLKELSESKILSASLNLIFSIVVLMMTGLSIFLIYSLLMVSVETRTFELGVFRMVGLTKYGLIGMILIQALMYAIPGWVLGLIVSQIIWIILRIQLGAILKAELGYMLSVDAILMSTLLGLLAPILASILPIRNALSQNLHDALDTRRSKTKAVVFTIERTRGRAISPRLLIIGTLMAVFGFLVYYLLPMALLQNNISLLFNIFLALLISMLLGLVMLSLNLQPLVERLLVWIFFQTFLRWESISLPKLVVKNLIAHRIRNRKTSIMYATALGFIIFITVAVRIELQSLMFEQMRKFYGDVKISIGNNVESSGYVTGIVEISAFERYCNSNPYIKGYAYKTFYMEKADKTVANYDIYNYGRTKYFKSALFGISPNFYDLPNPSFTIASEIDPQLNNAYSLSEMLYLKDAESSAHLGTLFKTKFSLDDFQEKFIYEFKKKGYVSRIPFRPSAFMNSGPSVDFSAYPGKTYQDLLVSYIEMLRVFNGTIDSIERLPMSDMLIKLNPGANMAKITKELSAIARYETVNNIEDEMSGMKDADATLSMIFQIITVAAMTVAFFSLNSSMVTNIFEQKMEIGVLRALGLTKLGVFRLYVYEAFFLVMSSAVLGTGIGVAVGWSMAAQRSVVSEVPLTFIFPTDIFLLVFCLSIACSIFATMAPIIRLVYHGSIVSIIRG